MSGLLSGPQRRLRHVEHFLARNIPRDPSTDSEVQCESQHPVWNPLPMETRCLENRTSFILSLFSHGDESQELIFECVIDLAKLQFVCKSISLLHELETYPTQSSNSQNSFVVLIKCSDGLFFPSLVEIVSPPIAPLDSAPLEVVRNDTTDQWDLVDGEIVREEERRLQRTDSMCLSDLKCLCTTTLAFSHMRGIAKHDQATLRSRISSIITGNISHSKVLREKLKRKLNCENLRRQITQKRELLGNLKARNKGLEEECADRAKSIAEDEQIVKDQLRTQRENLASRREELQLFKAEIALARVVILEDLAKIFPLNNAMICGAKSPDNEPETEEHAVALGQIAHVMVVFSALFNYALPHPIFLCSSRSYICEHNGVSDNRYPLFVARSADKTQLRKGVSLLQNNIISCALVTRNQHQAQGLPLLVGIEKLFENR